MDGTASQVVADNTLDDMIVELTLTGPKNAKTGKGLVIQVNRTSPADRGAVTSPATITSFLSSLLRVASEPSRGPGLHLA